MSTERDVQATDDDDTSVEHPLEGGQTDAVDDVQETAKEQEPPRSRTMPAH